MLDIALFGEEDSHLAVATNSELLKVFELSTWNCQMLQGHTDLIVGVTVHRKKQLLATCSKVNKELYRKLGGYFVPLGQPHSSLIY